MSPRRLPAALLAALGATLLALAAAQLALFIANGFDPAVFPAGLGFFGFSTLFVFVLVAVGAYLTRLRPLPVALLIGAIAGLLGAALGTTLYATLGGATFGGDLLNGVGQTLSRDNLLFILATTVATAAAGPRLLSLVEDPRPRVLRQGRTALVRLPASTLAAGVVTHIERVPVDTERADAQWAAYVDAFRAEGWEMVEVEAADDLADSVFVEDPIVIAGGLAILARPGSEHRRGEVAGVETAVRSLGLPIARIHEPGTLDGGDVLIVGDTVYVGRGGRTNADGIRQVRALLGPRGLTVVAVPLERVLHLKSAVTALPDGTVLGHPSTGVDPRIFPSYLEVPEPAGAHVVVLDPDTVLLAASAPLTAQLIESLGYRVVVVDIDEFEKLEGCVTCLSVRVR
ncbi:MAG: dimethylarginine dimethylaminohydrolase [Naasia sp.]|nr:dimethylarginine dimethylaminohydrolase [Naasia sp.]